MINLEKEGGGGVIMCEFGLAGYLFFSVTSCAALLLAAVTTTSSSSIAMFAQAFLCLESWSMCESECCPSRGAAFASAVAPYTSVSLYLSVSICTCVFKFYLSNLDVYILCSMPSIYYSICM